MLAFSLLHTHVSSSVCFRRMFPHCKVNLSGLIPCAKYILLVDMVPEDGFRYKVGQKYCPFFIFVFQMNKLTWLRCRFFLVVTTRLQTRHPLFITHPLLTLYIKGCYLFLFFYPLLGVHCTTPYLCGWYQPTVTLLSIVLHSYCGKGIICNLPFSMTDWLTICLLLTVE